MATVSFDQHYPHLVEWVREHGWIALGADEYSTSMIRVIDMGGMIWEGKTDYPTIDHALRDADRAIKEWLEENGL